LKKSFCRCARRTKKRRKAKFWRLDADELFAAPYLQQIDFRQFSRRRFATARRSRSCAIFRNSDRHHRASFDGRMVADAEFFTHLDKSRTRTDETPIARPFPFHLAHQVDFPLADLGDVSDWQAEWKWDGIRAQVIKRQDQVFVWSRGEDLITERFPEIARAAELLPNGTVLDGEILPWIDDRVMPFTELQKRIGRKNLSAKFWRKFRLFCSVTICSNTKARHSLV
jgi:ATP-dependent DNA ligase